MKHVHRWCLVGGVLFVAAGALVAALGINRVHSEHEGVNHRSMHEWHWYAATIDGMSCDVGIPVTDKALPIASGYFDLSTPVTAMVTSKSVTRFVSTREDVERQFRVFDESSAAREKYESTPWEEIKAHYDSINNPKWTPIEERLVGVFRVLVPDGEVCQVVTVALFRANGDESRAVGVTDVVRRGAVWKVMSKQSRESELWKSYRSTLLKSGNAALMECRKRAGVEPYANVLSK